MFTVVNVEFGRNLENWENEELHSEDKFGNVLWEIDQFKTKDKFEFDGILIPKDLIPYVTYYVTAIRPSFSRRYKAQSWPDEVSKDQHERGLFLNDRGLRYQRFSALPDLTNEKIGVRLTVTDWRKVMATAAVKFLDTNEVECINLADTHSMVCSTVHVALCGQNR